MKAQPTSVIPKRVVLRVGTVSHISWKLRLSNSPSRGPFNFTFTGGWIQFVTHYRIAKGDILVFSKLTANMSKFQVYVFDYEGLPVTRRVTRRIRSDLMHASRTRVKVSRESPPSTTRHGADVEAEDSLVMPHTTNLVPPSFQKTLLKSKLMVSSLVN